MIKRIIIISSVGVLGFFIFSLLTLYFKQESIIFLPSRDYNGEVERIGASEVYLRTGDGVKIHGLFKENKEDADYVLFFHGNYGNVSDRMWQMNFFDSLDLNYLMIDYRSYGKSEGIISQENQIYSDAEAAWDYLEQEKKIDPSRIIIWGRSLGGAISIDLAEKKNEKLLIAESTFSCMKNMKDDLYPYAFDFMLKYKMESYKKIGNCGSPLLIVHSPEDEMIDMSNADILFENAREPKTFLQISGSHNEGMIISEEKYRKGITDFLNNHKRQVSKRRK